MSHRKERKSGRKSERVERQRKKVFFFCWNRIYCIPVFIFVRPFAPSHSLRTPNAHFAKVFSFQTNSIMKNKIQPTTIWMQIVQYTRVWIHIKCLTGLDIQAHGACCLHYFFSLSRFRNHTRNAATTNPMSAFIDSERTVTHTKRADAMHARASRQHDRQIRDATKKKIRMNSCQRERNLDDWQIRFAFAHKINFTIRMSSTRQRQENDERIKIGGMGCRLCSLDSARLFEYVWISVMRQKLWIRTGNVWIQCYHLMDYSDAIV